MKRTKILLMIGTILIAGSLSLVATPTAEKQFADMQALEVSSQSLQQIKSSYDKLNEAVAREATEAQRELADARNKGDRTAYREAYQKLETLSSYGMSREASDALLEKLLALPESERSASAAWLYENSPFYRPTLTLDFSSEGENFRYSYRQQIRKQPGSDVVLPDAQSLRMNSSHLGVLTGWGLTPDEVSYEPGETIPMSYTDQTLYAIYEGGVRFVDELGDTDVLIKEGEPVTIPTPTTDDISAIFAGWYDRSTGSLITDPASYEQKGKGALYEALWKRMAIEDITVLYYDASALPKQTQIGIGFSYSNTGNVNLSGLKATLSSDSPHVRFLVDTLSLGRLSAGLSSTNNSRYATKTKQAVRGEAHTFRFVISDAAASGTVIPFSLKLANDRGDTWTQDFEVVVQ